MPSSRVKMVLKIVHGVAFRVGLMAMLDTTGTDEKRQKTFPQTLPRIRLFWEILRDRPRQLARIRHKQKTPENPR